MKAVKEYIFGQLVNNKIDRDLAKELLLELEENTTDDIAIIGMSVRLPKANNVEEFWNNLVNGVNSMDKASINRYSVWKEFYPEKFSDPDHENKLDVMGFLDEIDKFDTNIFKVSGKEAKYMDPVHRKFLEVAYEAVEDAGIGEENIRGTKTGVFVGYDTPKMSAYGNILEPDQLSLTGLYNSLLAGRFSYLFDLHGKSMVVDTACSSGLIALHEACEALNSKNCDMALVGGVFLRDNIFNDIDDPMNIILSNKKKIRTFDNEATGTMLGEGAGAILLKPLKKALKDKDNIQCVIKGSAVNSDGASNGITAPNQEAQVKVIEQAWKNAKVDPKTIAFIEAHGTGTLLGDPIEIKAITKAFAKYTDKKQFCGIGSAKSNIGHTVSASGIAAVVKMAMALKNKAFPPNINFEKPNQYIDFINSPVYVNDVLQEWKKESYPRRGGVSSFGFSGTNCHVIMEESPEITFEKEEKGQFHVLTISAFSKENLLKYVKNYGEFLEKNLDKEEVMLRDICYTSNTGRGHYEYRVALVADFKENMLHKIKKFLILQDSDSMSGIFYGHPENVMDEQNIQNQIEDYLDSDRKEKLCAVCSLYVQGAKVDWKTMYDQSARKISIPTYPFERISYWPKKKTEEITIGSYEYQINHPLLRACIVESIKQDIFLAELSVNNLWVLKEHHILEHYIMPGTGYLEMVYAIQKHYIKDGAVGFSNVTFIEPLIVEADEIKQLQIVIDKNQDKYDFSIVSKENKAWKTYCKGSFYQVEQEEKTTDIKGLLAQCSLPQDIGDYGDATYEKQGFGQRWTETIRKINVGDGNVLVELSLPEQFSEDLKWYHLHPSMLDNAVNAVINSVGKDFYLPLTYKSMKIYRDIPSRLFSHIILQDNSKLDSEIITFDINLYDEKGVQIIAIFGYTIKRVTPNNVMLNRKREEQTYLHEMKWVLVNRKEENVDKESTCILLAGKWKNVDNITKHLLEKFQNVYKIDIEELLTIPEEQVIKSVFHGIDLQRVSHIVYVPEKDDLQITNEKPLWKAQEYGVIGFNQLMKALVRNKVTHKLNITILTKRAVWVKDEERNIRYFNSPVIGAGKAVKFENTNIKVKAIDMDEETNMQTIVSEIMSSTDRETYLVVFRNGNCYVEELNEVLVNDNPSVIPIKKGGAYVITGGLGGIGFTCATYLASKESTNIILLGRNKNPDFTSLEKIIEMGSKVEYISCDISNILELEEVFNTIREKYEKVLGIFHCAGVPGKGFMFNKSMEEIKAVMLPKVAGTYNLRQVTKNDNLDFVMLCSSIVTLFGGVGQSDYCAANTFLDHICADWRGEGKNVITINWTQWSDVGMAYRQGVDENGIFHSVSSHKVLEYMDYLISTRTKRLVFGQLDYSHIGTVYQQAGFALSKDIIDKLETKKSGETKSVKRNNTIIPVEIKGKPSNQISDVERMIANLWGNVLEEKMVDLQKSFIDHGADSIIIYQLYEKIDMQYPGMIDVTDLYTYTTIIALACHIEGKMSEGTDKVDDYSEDENMDKQLLDLINSMDDEDTDVDDVERKLRELTN